MPSKKRFLTTVLFSVLLPAISFGNAELKTIFLGANRACPYNCEDFTKYQGYIVDLMHQIFDEVGYEVDYKIYDWAHALERSREGKLTAIIGLGPMIAEDEFILTQEPLGLSQFAFITRKEDKLIFDTRSQIESKQFGLTLGLKYSDSIIHFINRSNGQMFRTSPELDFKGKLKQLIDGEYDVLVEDANIANFGLNIVSGTVKPVLTKGLQEQVRISGYDHAKFPVYIAFSKEEPMAKVYAATVDRGVRIFRRDGRLGRILAAYGLQDWENKLLSEIEASIVAEEQTKTPPPPEESTKTSIPAAESTAE